MNNVILKLSFLALIIACGSQIETTTEHTEDLNLDLTSISCTINSRSQAWQHGYRSAQIICNNGAYGSVDSLCDPYLQIECVQGATAFKNTTHCRFPERLNQHAALLRLCPIK